MVSRPTSEDIEAKRQMIENEKLAHQNRLDSIDIIQKQIADSLAILDSIRYSNSRLVEVKNLTQESKDSLSFRYYVVVATFSKSENAAKYSESVKSQGYEPCFINYMNGYIAIGLNPANTLEQAYNNMRDIRSGFCPEAWILDNKK